MKTNETNNDYLLLKWGTLKGWCFENSPKALEALKEYIEIGAVYSAMAQKDTPRQKVLICVMIDEVNGPVQSDWDGTDWTDNRCGAKEYVLNYGKD